jgi:hypothetical protein
MCFWKPELKLVLNTIEIDLVYAITALLFSAISNVYTLYYCGSMM